MTTRVPIVHPNALTPYRGASAVIVIVPSPFAGDDSSLEVLAAAESNLSATGEAQPRRHTGRLYAIQTGRPKVFHSQPGMAGRIRI